MKARLIHATLLIIGIGAMGCGAVPEPPLVCTDEDLTIEYCQALGMVCNEAVTLADKCPAFVNELEVYIREAIVPMVADSVSFLPAFISVEDLVAMMFEEYAGVCGELDMPGEMGTCQFVGEEADSCAEDADCCEQLVCEQGICVVSTEPEPECLEDANCPVEHVCEQGVCVVPTEPEPGCFEDADCPAGHVCEQGICVVPTEPEPECLEDSDCPVEHVCEQGICMVAEAPECLRDADCRGPRICLAQRCEKIR